MNWLTVYLLVWVVARVGGRGGPCKGGGGGGADGEGCSGQISWGLHTSSGYQQQEGVVKAHYQQEGFGGGHKQAGPCKWAVGVLVVGDGVWEEWIGQVVEGTDWRKGTKDEWEAKERAVIRGSWLRGVDRGRIYDKGCLADGTLEKREPWLLLAVALSHFYPLLVI